MAAIVTPVVPQAGGVAIVRLSGSRAVDVVRRIFRPGRSGAQAWSVESHRAVYGSVVDGDGAIVDEARPPSATAAVCRCCCSRAPSRCSCCPCSSRARTRARTSWRCTVTGGACACSASSHSAWCAAARRCAPDSTCSCCGQRAGARLAAPGEFTLRAFLNGVSKHHAASDEHSLTLLQAASTCCRYIRSHPRLRSALTRRPEGRKRAVNHQRPDGGGS